MSPESRAIYSRNIRDEILATETGIRLEAGGYIGDVAQSEIRGAFSENHPSIDPTPFLTAKSGGRVSLQALENMLSAVRSAKEVKVVEAGAEFSIEVALVEEDGSHTVLDDISSTYFYHEPKKDEPKPFNGLTNIPTGPKIMNRGSTLLSSWVFFLGVGEEFDFLDESERKLHVKIVTVE